MTVAAPTAPIATTTTTTDVTAQTGEVDNRAAYVSFGFAYVFGHGTSALSQGADPLLGMPGWLPSVLLGIGLAAGTVHATIAAVRAQRGADASDLRSSRLLGLSWVIGFAALFLAITGLTATLDMPELQTTLWPTGAGLVVGLLYLGEGAARRNVLHYSLGTWLALTSTLALFLDAPGLFWVLTIAGGGGYAAAAVLERRRLVAAGHALD
ncbi:ABC transporter permease [Streptomyces sp. NBC_00467]|uniref:ABC transporter permease n=1 Tax=Streptomyces sp. NBC_00467 TaxID=2975752 RepID=UPI002E19B124